MITSYHVPVKTVPLSFFDNTFEVSFGGTAQTSFDEYGLVYSSDDDVMHNDLTHISMKDGFLGIGGTPSDNVWIQVSDDSDARMVIKSDGINEPTLDLIHPTVPWAINVDGYLGDMGIYYSDSLAILFANQGNVGIGVSDAVETLTLSGEIVLGDSLVSSEYEPGTIRYVDDRFEGRLLSEWVQFNSSSLTSQLFQVNVMEGLVRSSVIVANDSTLSGDRFWIDSVSFSTVEGRSMMLNDVDSSYVDGVNMRRDNINVSTIFATNLFISDAHGSTIHGHNVAGSFVLNSDIHGHYSSIDFLSRVRADLNRAMVAHALDSSIYLDQSLATYVATSSVHSVDSLVQYVDYSDVNVHQAVLRHGTSIFGSIHQSSVIHGSNLDLSLEQSMLTHVNHADISGQGIVSLGGMGITFRRQIMLGLLVIIMLFLQIEVLHLVVMFKFTKMLC